MSFISFARTRFGGGVWAITWERWGLRRAKGEVGIGRFVYDGRVVGNMSCDCETARRRRVAKNGAEARADDILHKHI